ncbi:MAG: ROK family protein [Salinivirgaceae bacterium]|jgi:polyphosphate glucokinase|nr:ROK family protein [Salinivirgaceae bacterium]
MEVLGIDVGGSGIKGAPVNIETGELLQERYRIETPQPATPEAVGNTIKKLVDHFEWNGKVGVGFPAAVQNGAVKTASNIDKSWIGVPINTFLSKKTGCEVHVANDADAAGMAEVKFGGGKDQKGVVILLTIGTGIGTVLFLDGKLFPNTELGHLEFKNTTIEGYAADSVRKKEDLSWKDWGKRFNKVLKHFEQMFYPELIIIGGGVSKKMERFKAQIDINTKLIPAELLNEAGIIGAAAFANE